MEKLGICCLGLILDLEIGVPSFVERRQFMNVEVVGVLIADPVKSEAERIGNTKPLLMLAPRECPPWAAPAGAARRQAERRGARSGQAAQEKGGLRLRGFLGARAS